YAAGVLAGLGGVETQGVATDAGTNLVVLAAHRLVNELAVGQPLTADNDAVKFAALNDLFRFGDELAHAHDNGGLDLGLYLTAEVVPVAERDFHGNQGDGGVMPAGGNGEAVDKAGVVQIFADVGNVLAGAAALEQVAAADAELQREVGAHGAADGGERLNDKAVAVLHALAAILVLA